MNTLTTLSLDSLSNITGGRIEKQLANAIWKNLGKGDATPSGTPRSASYPAGTVVCTNPTGTPVCKVYEAK